LSLLVFAGRSVCVGEVNSGSHPRFVLLRLFDLADSGWSAGRAFWRQMDNGRVSRPVDSRYATDSDRFAHQLRHANRASRPVWHRLGMFFILFFLYVSLSCWLSFSRFHGRVGCKAVTTVFRSERKSEGVPTGELFTRNIMFCVSASLRLVKRRLTKASD